MKSMDVVLLQILLIWAKSITNKKYNFCYLNNEELKMYENYDNLILDAAENPV